MTVQVQNSRPQPNTTHVVIAWIIAVFTFGYMVPWAIAATRGRSNAGAIGLLNFFAGWSVIGWVASLVMACGAEQNATNIVVVNQPYIHPGAVPPYGPPAYPAVQQQHAAPAPSTQAPNYQPQDPYGPPAVPPALNSPPQDPYAIPEPTLEAHWSPENR